MAGKLQFDISRLDSMSRKIQDSINTINAQNTSLQKRMKELEKDWNTDAGKKFFEEQNVDWEEAVKSYITVMGDLKKMINEAITQYEEVEREAEKISLPEL